MTGVLGSVTFSQSNVGSSLLIVVLFPGESSVGAAGAVVSGPAGVENDHEKVDGNTLPAVSLGLSERTLNIAAV